MGSSTFTAKSLISYLQYMYAMKLLITGCFRFPSSRLPGLGLGQQVP